MRIVSAFSAIVYRELMRELRTPIPAVVLWIVTTLIMVSVTFGLRGFGGAAAEAIDIPLFVATGYLGFHAFSLGLMIACEMAAEDEANFINLYFVGPLPRLVVLAGKACWVAARVVIDAVLILGVGRLLGAHLDLGGALRLIAVGSLSALWGGAAGMTIITILRDRRSAQALAPLISSVQLLFAGALMPLKDEPGPIVALSFLAPVRYAADLARGLVGQPGLALLPVWVNMIAILLGAGIFSVVAGWRVSRWEIKL